MTDVLINYSGKYATNFAQYTTNFAQTVDSKQSGTSTVIKSQLHDNEGIFFFRHRLYQSGCVVLFLKVYY